MPKTIDHESSRPRPDPWSPAPVPVSVLRRSRARASLRRFHLVLMATMISTLAVVGDRMVDA